MGFLNSSCLCYKGRVAIPAAVIISHRSEQIMCRQCCRSENFGFRVNSNDVPEPY